MENQVLPDYKACQEMMEKPVLKVLKVIAVYLDYRDCQVQQDHLGTKVLQETMVTMESLVSKAHEGPLVWTAMLDLLDFQVPLAQEDPKEKKENGVLGEKEELPDLQVLQAKEWDSTWLLLWQIWGKATPRDPIH